MRKSEYADGMSQYVCLFIEDGECEPLSFHCWAEDMDHADEQCEDANPGCQVVWAKDFHGQCALEDAVYAAYRDYYNSLEEMANG